VFAKHKTGTEQCKFKTDACGNAGNLGILAVSRSFVSTVLPTSNEQAIRDHDQVKTTYDMIDIPKTDKLFLILHRAGWSIGDTAFAGKEGLSWLIYGTSGDHLIQVHGNTKEDAWKQACR
jgi:hypothetical protein